MKVTICVITCQRLDGLRGLLEALNRLSFSRLPFPEISVVVVDNDSASSASVLRGTMVLGRQIDYFLEERKGIPFARNRCLKVATASADFLAFIDDDEVPDERWLEELLVVQKSYDAPVVAGPVISRFQTPPPQWIIDAKCFDLPRFKTGTRQIRYPGTGNVLIRCAVLRETGICFEEQMALTGGSDTNFFMKLLEAGFDAVWADEATIWEWVPESRANLEWILKRSYRLGASIVLSERFGAKHFTILHIGVRFLKSVRCIFLGALTLLPARMIGKHRHVVALQSLWRGYGMLVGLFGVKYEEYKVIHRV